MSPNALNAAPISTGSPSAVPVPWASSVAPEFEPHTARKSRDYDKPLGAVRLALGPSCYTAVPTTVAPLRPSVVLKRKAPQPSPQQYPSARSSKVWQRPRDEVIPLTAVPKFDHSPRVLVAALITSPHSRRPRAAIA